MADQERPGETDTTLTPHATTNRALWERTSNDYEQRHADSLSGQNVLSWGV